MQVSEQWLREWVSLSISTSELVAQLTMAGLEVDAIQAAAGAFNNVVVGEIISAEPHPDAAKLRVCSVNSGSETLQIVCGAANARPGIRIPLAKIGATLPNGMEIKQAKLRGVDSFGMLCAAEELGLAESSEGLLELPLDAPIGQSLREYMKLNDQSILIDLTPNRSDCLSVKGLAREIGVLNRTEVKPLKIEAVAAKIADSFPVELFSAESCPNYIGRVIRNVKAGVTPLWMAEKLRRSGLRCIDPIVDVTNYILLELGQPMHAFDLNKLNGGIKVRKANAGEKLELLNGQTVELDTDTLVIADHNGPLAMAGIMGGQPSAVSSTTSDIFLESAFFSPTAITGRARRYGLHTDSSHRFERGVDYQLQVQAIERATQLLLEIVGGEPGPVVQATSANDLPVAQPIALRLEKISRLLGFNIAKEEIGSILSLLGMSLHENDNGWQVTAPSYRFDISIEEDLIEEIARVYGYNNLPTHAPARPIELLKTTEINQHETILKRVLVDRDYQEAVTYTFVDQATVNAFNEGIEPLALINPITADMSVMRTSLLQGLAKTALYNLNRQQTRVRIFETGLRFVPKDGQLTQDKMIAALITGSLLPQNWSETNRAVDFFDLKGDLEALLATTGALDEYRFVAEQNHPSFHPGQCARVVRSEQTVGFIGALHPSAQKSLGFDQTVYAFELQYDLVKAGRLPKFSEISRFPEVTRDLAILIEQSINAESVLGCIRDVGTELLRNVVIFDVYTGKGVEAGKKSVAVRLTFQHDNQTLQDNDVNATIDHVLSLLKQRFNAALRV